MPTVKGTSTIPPVSPYGCPRHCGYPVTVTAPDPLKAAIEDVTRAVERALSLVRDMPSGQVTFEAASELAVVLRAGVEAAGHLRGLIAAHIRDSERLSLSVLARRIGVSKQRAAELVRLGKEKLDKEEKP